MIVRPARWPDDADAVRALLREYGADEAHAAGLCFQRFEEELADLPGKYSEPAGCFLVAEEGGELVGCVALRPVSGGDAEMMYLPKLGIRGNSHMLMQDRNNLQLADMVIAWIDKHVESKATR